VAEDNAQPFVLVSFDGSHGHYSIVAVGADQKPSIMQDARDILTLVVTEQSGERPS
jgi:hypothetical protein